MCLDKLKSFIGTALYGSLYEFECSEITNINDSICLFHVFITNFNCDNNFLLMKYDGFSFYLFVDGKWVSCNVISNFISLFYEVMFKNIFEELKN